MKVRKQPCEASLKDFISRETLLELLWGNYWPHVLPLKESPLLCDKTHFPSLLFVVFHIMTMSNNDFLLCYIRTFTQILIFLCICVLVWALRLGRLFRFESVPSTSLILLLFLHSCLRAPLISLFSLINLELEMHQLLNMIRQQTCIDWLSKPVSNICEPALWLDFKVLNKMEINHPAKKALLCFKTYRSPLNLHAA